MSSLLLAIVLALHALVLAGNAQPPEPSCAPERWPHAQYAPITRDTLDQLEPVVSFECDTPVELVGRRTGGISPSAPHRRSGCTISARA